MSDVVQPITFGTIPDYLVREDLGVRVDLFSQTNALPSGNTVQGYRYGFPGGAVMTVLPDPLSAPRCLTPHNPWRCYVELATEAEVSLKDPQGNPVTWLGIECLAHQTPESVLSLIRMVAKEA